MTHATFSTKGGFVSRLVQRRTLNMIATQNFGLKRVWDEGPFDVPLPRARFRGSSLINPDWFGYPDMSLSWQTSHAGGGLKIDVSSGFRQPSRKFDELCEAIKEFAAGTRRRAPLFGSKSIGRFARRMVSHIEGTYEPAR